MRPLLLVPEMLVFGGGLLVLIAGSFLPRERQWVTRVVAVAVLLGAIVTAAAGLTGAAQSAFEGTFVVDTATGVARIVAAAGVLLVLMLATDEIADSPRESETYALLLFSTAGALLLAGADDLLVLAVGFLLTSIPLYALIGLAGTARGAEAAMKTYLLGALCGIALLLGVTVLYAVTGSTAYTDLEQRLATAPVGAVAAGLVGVLAGLLFKAGAAPAHFWVPDAAEGASATVATFLTTVPKVGALVAVYRLVTTTPEGVDAGLLVALLAVASMTLGNLAAYWQRDPRRLLGWSTVSQVGYLLVPVAAAGASDLALPSLLVYLAGYTVTNIAAFSVTAALPSRRELSAWHGLAGARPWLAGALVVALLGLVGTPPTVVFVGKLTTATAAWDGGYAWLALVLLGNTVLSLFYYLRWIVPVLGRGEGTARTMRGAFVPAAWSGRTAVLTAVLTVVLGLASGALWGAVDGVTR